MARSRSPSHGQRSVTPDRRHRSESDRKRDYGDRDRTRAGSRDRDRGYERDREKESHPHSSRDRDDRDRAHERGWDREKERDREAGSRSKWDRDRENKDGRDEYPNRTRDRDAERRRRVTGPPMDTLTPEQQKQLEALQQADMKRQLQRQQVLLHNGAGGLNAAMAANKKQREVYVGNLAIGAVSEIMLRELFNAALAHFVADPVTRPPVVSTTMDGSGRFGFVELRTEELAAEAMKLDKVNLGGREINVGRPKGYIEPPPGSRIDPNKPTLTLFMENLLSVGQVRVDADRIELQEEVEEECRAIGGLAEAIVPAPPLWVANEEPCPVFCRFVDDESAKKVKEAMNGRQFENNTVTAKFIGDDLWGKVKGGEWVDHKLVIDNPLGFGSTMPPQQANSTLYPNLLPQALMGAGYVAGAGGPGQAGGGYVMRISNLPAGIAKFDIVRFLDGCGIGEGHVRLVKGSDGVGTGEAYIDCPSAESLGRGIALDRTPFLESGVFVTVQSSSIEERNTVTIDGLQLV